MPKPRTNFFLDIEAQEDTEERESDDEEEEEHEFIMDDIVLDEETTFPRAFEDSRTEYDIEKLIEDIYESATHRSNHGTNLSKFQQDARFNPEWNLLHRSDSYPLYLISCRIGSEDVAACSLLKTANDRHHIRSAFTRGSLRGSIYLECQMSQPLIDLLGKTPGVIQTAQGPRYRLIDSSEYGNILRMTDPDRDFQVGNWVHVKGGIYTEDVGLVVGISSWGVNLLLIPRLSTTINRKRKHGTPRPEPNLFEYDKFCTLFPGQAASTEEEMYSINDATFSYGLLCKNLDYHSIVKPVLDIPWRAFERFRTSKHPRVLDSRLPRPREWTFTAGEKILDPTSEADHDSYAVIDTIDPFFVTLVDRRDRLSWHRVLKYFEVGDFIRVLSGPFEKEIGWVVQILEQTVFFFKQSSDTEQSTTNVFEIHPNCIIFLPPDDPHGGHFISMGNTSDSLAPARIERKECHPWYGLEVTITRLHHGRKGHHGVVKEVLSSDVKNSMRLEIQLARYDPAAPFRTITVDLEDVVISSTQQLLSIFVDPNTQVCMPVPVVPTASEECEPSGSCTPTGSPTAIQDLTFEELLLMSPGVSLTSRGVSPHRLLDNRLLNLALMVIVNGGEFANKEMVVSVSLTENTLAFIYQRYKAQVRLDSGWVKPKHPSLTHENGLLVVIDGEHFGKFARRIHHRGHLMILAVVIRTYGGNTPDTLMSETIDIPPESLCIVWETKKEKAANKQLMKHLRDSYHTNLVM